MSVFVCNLSDSCLVYTHEHDIHHLLGKTFMCIFSSELLQRSTMNNMDKNILLYSWWEGSATYNWEVFALSGNKQFLSSFQINRRLQDDGELSFAFKALWYVSNCAWKRKSNSCSCDYAEFPLLKQSLLHLGILQLPCTCITDMAVSHLFSLTWQRHFITGFPTLKLVLFFNQ